MIPRFPSFKKLEVSDKKHIECITALYPPYSDFNFASLWSYNVVDDIVISSLNKNIIVRFRDYITNEPFFSFIGTSQISETISTLFQYAKKSKHTPVLKLVPVGNFQPNHLVSSIYTLQEDPDNYDYIYSTKELSELRGTKYEKKRNHIHKFVNEYPDVSSMIVDIQKSDVQKELINLFFTWEINKQKTRDDTEHELIALKRLLSHAHHFHLLVLAVRHKEKLIAFTIVEMTQEKYGVFHFTKANTVYRGAYTMLYHLIAKELYSRGYTHVNREQDLGIEGLRVAKKGWNPVHYLKKYIVYPAGYKDK